MLWLNPIPPPMETVSWLAVTCMVATFTPNWSMVFTFGGAGIVSCMAKDALEQSANAMTKTIGFSVMCFFMGLIRSSEICLGTAD